ncbi:MAG: hypothetical protein ACPGYY_10105 [Bacteroidia bacterium]
MNLQTTKDLNLDRFNLRKLKQVRYILASFLCCFFLANASFAQTTYLSQDFSTASGSTPPTGWTNNTVASVASDSWVFDNPASRTVGTPISGNFAIFDSDNYSNNSLAEDVELISPSFNASSATVLTLSFDHYFRSGAGGAIEVEVYNGSAWVSVLSTSTGAGSSSVSDSRQIDILTAANGATNAQIKFSWTGNYSWYWAIDNIKVSDDPVSLITNNPRDYSERHVARRRGNFAMIGNSNVTCDTCSPSVQTNNNMSMEYSDIDSDPSTVNSSWSTLTMPTDAQVTWAGLYWGGVDGSTYAGISTSPYGLKKDTIKFRTPASSAYTKVEATDRDVQYSVSGT